MYAMKKNELDMSVSCCIYICQQVIMLLKTKWKQLLSQGKFCDKTNLRNIV